LTAKVQEALAAKVAADRLTLLEPATAVIVPPPQLPVRPLGDDTLSPDGNASVKPMPLRDVAALGFDRLKVSVVVPFNATLAAPNVFAIVGGKLAGGGGLPEPDEPPPQAELPSKPEAMPRDSDTVRIFVQTAGAVFRSFLFLR